VIVVWLSGGLGNQMFQYAAGRALAARHGTRLVLDSSWIDGRGGGAPDAVRRYELDCFDLDAELAPIEQVARLPTGSQLRDLAQGVRHPRRPLVTPLGETSFGEPESAVLEARDDTYLRGLWQREVYFERAAALVRADFTFRTEHEPAAADAARSIERASNPPVSVHVRRGDYVSDPGASGRLGTLGIDYYAAAIELLAERLGDLELFVFSDDLDWCRAHLRLPFPATVVDLAGGRAHADLRLMSMCAHHVIANSSFSWWAAWLDPMPEKIVVAPRPWLSDPASADAGRVPPGWVRIDR
jgi:hypothetical protein